MCSSLCPLEILSTKKDQMVTARVRVRVIGLGFGFRSFFTGDPAKAALALSFTSHASS